MTSDAHRPAPPPAEANELAAPPDPPRESDGQSEGQPPLGHVPQSVSEAAPAVVAPRLRTALPIRPGGKPGRSGPPGNRNARKHGGSRAGVELKELVRRSMDGRTTEAREVGAWITAYAVDLGGLDDLTTAQRALLQAAGATWLQLRRVDAFIARMETIANAKRRALYPIVVQRTGLVTTLRGLLGDLGLERRARDVTDLQAYLNGRAQPAASGGVTEASTRLDREEDQ